MWYLDVPQQDPDSNYPAPSMEQLMDATCARDHLQELKLTLQRLTVPQQRTILNEIRDELVGGLYRKMPLHVSPDGSSCERPYTPGRPAA
ncbi:MAG TPA: hypothetical protein VMT95_00925 [Candidatus Binatia bacterium]|nr:hypothetical protein [Candidatus Binatia bacterium]